MDSLLHVLTLAFVKWITGQAQDLVPWKATPTSLLHKEQKDSPEGFLCVTRSTLLCGPVCSVSVHF